MEAIVLAGGFGTRLSHIVKDVPKPMAPVAGKPFLEYILDDLVRQGVTRIVIAVHYKKERIMEYFGNAFHGAEILYSVEETPLLTGGAIKKAQELCLDDVVWIINGDTYFEVPLAKMRSEAEASAKVVIAVKEMQNFSRYGQVDITADGRVTAFREKAPCEQGFINGGVYCLRKSTLDSYPEKFSLENDCFPQLLETGGIYALESRGYFIDIGVPEDYYKAQQYFEQKGNSH